MEELLKSFSPVEIILCVWLVVKGLTEVIQKFDWGKSRLKQVFDRDYRAKERHKKLEDTGGSLETF